MSGKPGVTGQILCAQSWVDTCHKVDVDFRFVYKQSTIVHHDSMFIRRLGKSKLKLPVGEVFSKKGKDNVGLSLRFTNWL